MQFTVLIEFLLPGLATTLLMFSLVPSVAFPHLPPSLPTGDAVTALLLLAVSYPVGILTSFPVYIILQYPFLAPNARRRVVARYLAHGVKLVKLGGEQFNLISVSSERPVTNQELRELFNLMSAVVSSKNIDRFNADHFYHQSLQRLARGMLLPLIMAGALIWNTQDATWDLLVGAFLVCALWLQRSSVLWEEEGIARYFVALAGSPDDRTLSTS